MNISMALLMVSIFVASPSNAANPWTVSTSTSAAGVKTTALQNASGTDGTFVVYCTSSGDWGYRLETGYAIANGAVRYRIGPGSIVTETWTPSAVSGSPTLFPASSRLSLLKEIHQNWDVVFQYNSMPFGSQTLQFNASGFSEAIDQTRAACEWPADLLPADNGWGKALPSAPPFGAQEASYISGALNQFPLTAWRAHNSAGKPQLLARLGDRNGPCTGPLPVNDHRLYVTQGDRTISAVSGRNFEIDCLGATIVVPLNGDFDAGKAFTLRSYPYHASANSPGTPMASIAFDDQVAPLVTVIEYYSAAFDHYFITWVPAEIALLDAGTTIKGWVRTGKSFATYTTALMATSPVCRYYIPPRLGDSHFFGRGVEECDATGRSNPDFVLEEAKFLFMYMPSIGVCPPNTTEVYRVFSNRPDANHRYMTDKAVRDAMVAQRWRVEGDGPNFVVMCAPQ